LRRRPVLAAAMIAISLAVASAAQVLVRLSVPPPGRYGIEDLWKATVVSDSSYDNVWFEGFVLEARQGQVFWAKTKTFSLTRGTKVFGYHSVTIDETKTAPGYEAFLTRQGTLPQGRYSFELVLKPFDVGDSNGFEVKPMGPPRLISPRDGDTVRARYPQFVWAPPVPRPSGRVTFGLKLVQLLPGQTKEEAMSVNLPWFEKRDMVGTSLVYPSSAQALESGEDFAWQVTGSPGGTSETRRLAMGKTARMLTREEVVAIILKQVIKPESLDHDVVAFLGRAPLGPADTLAEASDNPWQKTFSKPTWFGWVNDRPLSYFARPTRYVFVDASTGELGVEVRNWWPSLNRNWIWVTPEELAGDRHVIFLETKGGGR